MADLLAFVADLRDRTAKAEHVEWRREMIGDVDPDLLCHLVPPTSGHKERWHEVHRFGLLYYRRGPGFVIVYDGRPIAVAKELLLDDPDEVQLFERLSQPGPLTPGDPAASRMRAAGLLLEVDGMAVALPYREARLALPLDIFHMPSIVPNHVDG